jgi:hypothetical protein
MKRCRTCRYWDEEGKKDNNISDEMMVVFHRCLNEKLDSKDAMVPKQHCCQHLALDEAGAEYVDDVGLCIRTGPRFGCIHHRPK